MQHSSSYPHILLFNSLRRHTVNSDAVLGRIRVATASLGGEGLLDHIRAVPFGGADRVHSHHIHRVDLFKRSVLGLDHEEEDETGEEETAEAKHEAVEVVDLVRDECRAERDQEVEQPVASSGQSHARGAVAGWVDFGDDGPDEGTPGGGEGDDEEAGEDNKDVAGGFVAVEGEMAHEGVDHEADEGPEGADDQCPAAGALLHDVKAAEGAADVDGAEDDLGDVGIAETDLVEDSCAVVEEEVGSGKLLSGLEDNTCLLYTSPSPRDGLLSRMPSSA